MTCWTRKRLSEDREDRIERIKARRMQSREMSEGRSRSERDFKQSKRVDDNSVEKEKRRQK